MVASVLSCRCSLSFECATSYPASGSVRLWPWLSVVLAIPQQDNTCSSSRSTSRGFSKLHSTTAYTKRWVRSCVLKTNLCFSQMARIFTSVCCCCCLDTTTFYKTFICENYLFGYTDFLVVFSGG